MKPLPLRHGACMLFAAMSLSAAAGNVTLEVSPGTLKSSLAAADTVGMTTLTLTGDIDVRDLAVAAALPLDRLDLAATRVRGITSATELLPGRYTFDADRMPDYVFFMSPVRECVLPATLKSIGDGCFAASALTTVTVTEGVTHIGDYAFRGCTALTSASLPRSLAELGAESFAGCTSLAMVTFDSECPLTEIAEQTFAGCTSLATVALPDHVRHIGSLIFSDSAVRSAKSNGPVTAEPFALAEAPKMEYSNIIISPACTAEGLYLGDAVLKSVTSEYTSIPAATFAGAPSVDASLIMNGISRVGDFAFYDYPFDQVTLSADITELGRGVFGNANQLQRIFATDLEDRVPAVDGHTFDGLDREKVSIVVLHKYREVWENAAYWNEFPILDEYSGIDTVEDTSFAISYHDGKVSISASTEIKEVVIADEAGRILASASPGSTRAEITVANTGGRIIIVNSLTGSSRRSDKIIIPAS